MGNIYIIIFILIVLVLILLVLRYILRERFISAVHAVNIYVGKTDEWYVNFVRKIFPLNNIIKDDQSKARSKDDIVVYTFTNRDKFNDRAFNIFISGEPYSIDNIKADLIIDCKNQNIRSNALGVPVLYVPFFSMCFAEHDALSPFDLLKKRKVLKPKFCAYAYSNCDRKFPGVDAREKFFDILNAYEHVDVLGQCKGGGTASDYIRNPQGHGWMDNIKMYGPYTFVVAFENTVSPDYITEKIIVPMLSGAIPIYRGAKEICEHFNCRSIINLNDTSSLDQGAYEVLNVFFDRTKLDEMLNESWISDRETFNKDFSWFVGGDIYDRLKELVPMNKYYPVNIKEIEEVGRTFMPPLSPKVTDIYVINLDTSRDRWTSIQTQLNGYSYSRFPAIEGKKVLQGFPKRYIGWEESLHQTITPGEFGVYLSNLVLWYHFLSNDTEYMIVLEDDVTVSANFLKYDDYIHKLPENWDIAYLGTNDVFCGRSTVIKGEQVSPGIYRVTTTQCMPGAYAYVVNKKGAMNLLRNSLPIRWPVDEYMRLMFDSLNVYALNPVLVDMTHEFDSTINLTVTGKALQRKAEYSKYISN